MSAIDTLRLLREGHYNASRQDHLIIRDLLNVVSYLNDKIIVIQELLIEKERK